MRLDGWPLTIVSRVRVSLYRLGGGQSIGLVFRRDRRRDSLGFVDAEIISIGTELTQGLTVDTNAAWLSTRLAAIGVTVRRHVTVPDRRSAIRDAVSEACTAQVVLVSGGLGPTADDLTRESLADAVGRSLIADAGALAQIQAFFDKLGRPMTEGNEKQALIPGGGTALANTCGTAPGIRVEHGDAVVYALPGVPRELMAMYERSIEPELIARSAGKVLVCRSVNCFGASEAVVGSQIKDLMAPERHPVVGITVREGVMKIRITAAGVDGPSARSAADADVLLIRERLGKLVFGEDDQTLQEAVGASLTARGATLTTAESCTGGLLAARITEVPGCSRYFLQGAVTYANEAKSSLLGVSRALIEAHGAVSEEVAAAMAKGARAGTDADYALSVTGVAGPQGGSPAKPVGLVFIGLADRRGCRVRRCVFGDYLDRASIRERSCNVAMNILRLHVMCS